MQIKQIAYIAAFSALAIVLGYVFSVVPNVELFTPTIFLSGLLLGSFGGACVGSIAAFIFALYNPWGASPAPLLIAQVLTRALIGFCGGLLMPIAAKKKPAWLRPSIFGLSGLILISIYNVACAISFVISAGGLTLPLLMQQLYVGFFLISLATVSNLLTFAIIAPGAYDALKRAGFTHSSK